MYAAEKRDLDEHWSALPACILWSFRQTGRGKRKEKGNRKSCISHQPEVNLSRRSTHP